MPSVCFGDTIRIESIYEIDLEKVQTLEDMQKLLPVVINYFEKSFTESEVKGMENLFNQTDEDLVSYISKQVQRSMLSMALYGRGAF